jgi:copper resistance protein B
MRAGILVAALLLALPAHAADRMHGGQVFHYAEIEGDVSRTDGETVATWDAQGWLGTDMDKLWVKSEGDVRAGRVDTGEAQLLYSRNLGGFFDVQGGVRLETVPDARAQLVLGVQGLAPYLLDSQAHLFLAGDGTLDLRLRQRVNLLLTNRLVMTPMLETDVRLAGERRGFSGIETGVQMRYEIRRKFAPYVALLLDRKLGAEARAARAQGEAVGGWAVRTGLRLWF